MKYLKQAMLVLLTVLMLPIIIIIYCSKTITDIKQNIKDTKTKDEKLNEEIKNAQNEINKAVEKTWHEAKK